MDGCENNGIFQGFGVKRDDHLQLIVPLVTADKPVLAGILIFLRFSFSADFY